MAADRWADPNAKVHVLAGDPEGDDTWEVEVDGRHVRVAVENGEVVDTTFTEMFRGDPDNASVIMRTANEAVREAIERHNASKGFGYSPDVEF